LAEFKVKVSVKETTIENRTRKKMDMNLIHTLQSLSIMLEPVFLMLFTSLKISLYSSLFC